MTLQQLYIVLLVGGLVVLASIGAARVASRVGVPVLLAFLGVGVALGEAGAGVRFDNAQIAEALGTAALAVILVEGGLTTRWATIRHVLAPATVLGTLGVGVSLVVVAAAAHLLLDASWRYALLLGAVVSSTDAAAVFSVLRALPLPHRLAGLLEAESGLNDAPTVILVVAFSVGTVHPGPLLLTLVYELAAGAVIGVAAGAWSVWVLRRISLPASGLYPTAVFASGMVAFAAAGAVHASGFLAAYLAAVVLGNAGLPHRRAIQSVAEGLGWISQIGLFVMLGLLATPSRLPSAVVPAVVVGLALLLVARPLAVLASLLPFRVPLREMGFLSWAGLRGAVPIVLTTIPLVAGVPDASRLFDVVFVLVVIFTLVQAPPLPAIARLLGVSGRAMAAEMQVESAPLDRVHADLLHVSIAPTSKLHNVEVFELRLPAPAAVTLVIRGGEAFVPDHWTRLRHGDELLIVTTPDTRPAVERRLRAIDRAGRLATWRGETGEEL